MNLASIFSKSGSSEEWCHFLQLDESICNNIRFEREPESLKILHVVKAFVDENVKLCWEKIVYVLCNFLHNTRLACSVANKYKLKDYEFVCNSCLHEC